MDQNQVPLQSCPDCAAQMPENAAFCPGCGRSMRVIGRAQGKVGALPENIAGALAYVTFVPAIIFLLVKPYRRDEFVRFHSLQCLAVWAAALVLALVLKLVGLVLFIIPMLGPLLVLLLDVVVPLAGIFLWLVLLVKAFQGESFRLPWLGDLAQKYAASV